MNWMLDKLCRICQSTYLGMRVVVKYGFRVLAGDFSLVQLQMHYIKAQCCTSNLNSIFIDNTISKYPSISMISAGSLRPVPFLQGQLAARLFLVGTISGRGLHGVVPEPGRKCRYVFIRSSRVI